MDDKTIEETEYLMMLLYLPPQTPNVSIIQQSVSIEIVDDDGNMYTKVTHFSDSQTGAGSRAI